MITNMGNKLRNTAGAVIVLLLLTGCSQVFNPMPTMTVSERELCQSNSELTPLVANVAASPGNSELKDLVVHLAGVTAVLSAEESEIVPMGTDLNEHLLMLNAIMADQDLGHPLSLEFPGEFASILSDASKASGEIAKWCNEMQPDSEFQSLTNELSEVYEDGIWREDVRANLLQFITHSMNTEVEVVLDDSLGEVASYEQKSDVVFLGVFCNVETMLTAFTLGRRDKFIQLVEYGPNGRVKFKYSLNGGELVEDVGYFQGGYFFPFVTSFTDSNRIEATKKAVETLLLNNSELRIVIDSPGSKTDSRFDVRSASKIVESFKSFECPGF